MEFSHWSGEKMWPSVKHRGEILSSSRPLAGSGDSHGVRMCTARPPPPGEKRGLLCRTTLLMTLLLPLLFEALGWGIPPVLCALQSCCAAQQNKKP